MPTMAALFVASDTVASWAPLAGAWEPLRKTFGGGRPPTPLWEPQFVHNGVMGGTPDRNRIQDPQIKPQLRDTYPLRTTQFRNRFHNSAIEFRETQPCNGVMQNQADVYTSRPPPAKAIPRPLRPPT